MGWRRPEGAFRSSRTGSEHTYPGRSLSRQQRVRKTPGIRSAVAMVHTNPGRLLRVVTVWLMAMGFVWTMASWIVYKDASPTDVPMKLTAVLTIMLMIARVKGGASTAIATLIVGSLVAGERVVIAAAALWSGGSAQDVAALYRSVDSQASNVPAEVSRIASRVSEEVSQSGDSAETVAKLIEAEFERAGFEGSPAFTRISRNALSRREMV